MDFRGIMKNSTNLQISISEYSTSTHTVKKLKMFSTLTLFFSRQAPEVDAMLYCDLLSLLGEKPQLIRETVQSPLWNLIHFELAYNTLTDEFCDITDYDDSSKVYKKSTINETPEHVQHIAVLAYSTRRYDRNDHTRRIFLNYSINHLKKEGFKVIEISPFKVGRMSMADTEDRLKYLQNLFEEQNIRLPVDKKKGILET